MTSNEKIDKLLAEQSSEWISALDRKGDEHDPAFAEWLLDSKRNVKLFLMTAALDRELGRFDPERKLTIPSLKEGAEVVPLHAPDDAHSSVAANDPVAPAASRRFSALRWASLAAALVVTLAILMTLKLLPEASGGWQQYATAVGEQRVIELADGSTVRLNTQSRIAVKLSEHTRDIQLLDGEAIFKVHHDTSRPFRVHTQGAFIQAVGTEFNVYRRANRTEVAVLEGRVQISTTDPAKPLTNTVSGSAKALPLLGAGEETEIDNKGQVAAQRPADISRVSAWSHSRLVFKQESLAEIVTQFNRYNRTPQFRVVGDAIAGRRYSGAFNAYDPQSLRALLAGEPDLMVEQRGDEIVIRARPELHTAHTDP